MRIRRGRSRRRGRGVAAAGVVLVALATVFGCGRAAPQSVPSGEPAGRNVLLVVVEALPAHLLGAYGSEVGATPNLDRWAKEGAVFERFHAAAPWTMPSFAAMLTGLPPGRHRAGRYIPAEAAGRNGMPRKDFFGLRKSAPFLPALLRGVKSAAIVNNSFLHRVYGFGRGWRHYDYAQAGYHRYRTAEEVTDRALVWLKAHRGKRHFLMVHYFDPHLPYRPPAPFAQRFRAGKKGRVNMANNVQLVQWRFGQFQPTPDEQAYYRGMHRGEVAYADCEIGRLLDTLSATGALRDTWTIITADHGEELFEHGGWEHGHRFEEELTRVPLIVLPPGGTWNKGTRVPYAARHIDIAPTVLDWFGLPPNEEMDGRSLMPLLRGEERAHRPTYMAFPLVTPPSHAYFDGRFKIIERVDRSSAYMYDLDADPKERTPLYAEHPRFGPMQQRLREIHDGYEAAAEERFLSELDTAGAPDAPVQVSPEVLESLRSLGYID